MISDIENTYLDSISLSVTVICKNLRITWKETLQLIGIHVFLSI
jgi:hypothetical protein